MYRAFRPSPANVTSRAGTAVMTDPFYCVGWMNLLVFKSECRPLICKKSIQKGRHSNREFRETRY